MRIAFSLSAVFVLLGVVSVSSGEQIDTNRLLRQKRANEKCGEIKSISESFKEIND